MGFKVVVIPTARADLEEYADWIAEDSPDQARKWLIEAWETIFSLREMPARFAIIDEAEELGAEVRDVLHHSHRIVYRVREDEQIVEVLRVWHGARRAISQADVE